MRARLATVFAALMLITASVHAQVDLDLSELDNGFAATPEEREAWLFAEAGR
ncbi:MAG: hypothetical protein RL701_102, partial [Pseudomonadota bacterium]